MTLSDTREVEKNARKRIEPMYKQRENMKPRETVQSTTEYQSAELTLQVQHSNIDVLNQTIAGHLPQAGFALHFPHRRQDL